MRSEEEIKAEIIQIEDSIKFSIRNGLSDFGMPIYIKALEWVLNEQKEG